MIQFARLVRLMETLQNITMQWWSYSGGGARHSNIQNSTTIHHTPHPNMHLQLSTF